MKESARSLLEEFSGTARPEPPRIAETLTAPTGEGITPHSKPVMSVVNAL